MFHQRIIAKGSKHHSSFVHVLYFNLYLLEKSLSRMDLRLSLPNERLGTNIKAANAVQNNLPDALERANRLCRKLRENTILLMYENGCREGLLSDKGRFGLIRCGSNKSHPLSPFPPLHSLYSYATILMPLIPPATTTSLKRPHSDLEDSKSDEETHKISPTSEMALPASPYHVDESHDLSALLSSGTAP